MLLLMRASSAMPLPTQCLIDLKCPLVLHCFACSRNVSAAAPLSAPAARGMLRLEPAGASEHARWVLALNAAFLASGAAAAQASGSCGAAGAAAGGGDGTLEAVGDQCWSAAILFG